MLVGGAFFAARGATRAHHHEFAAMSTLVRLTVFARRAPDWILLERSIAAWAAPLDHRVPGSALQRLNEQGILAVGADGEPELRAVLGEALTVAAATEGAFDPTILPLTELWDFDAGGRLPPPQAIAAVLAVVDHTAVTLTPSLTLGPRQAIDLGGIGKGAVVDRVADHLEAAGIGRYLVEAGGDLLVSGLKPGDRQWRIWLEHPRASGTPLAILTVGRAGARIAVVTSGDYERFFEQDGVRYHHLLDPRTGQPARRATLVTVLAASASLADAAATALFVMGPDGLRSVAAEFQVEALVLTGELGRLSARSTAGFPVEIDALNLN